MAFDINNFVIDRVIRGIMTSTADGSYLFSCNQLRDPSIGITADSVEVTDAIGSRIAQFDRAKSATLTATNALFDLNLASAQFGSKKNVASATNKIVTPAFEDITLTTGQTEVILKKIPTGTAGAEIKFIYELKGDDTLGIKYVLGATASATDFELDAATKTITLPTGLSGSRIFVMYDYEAESAVEVVNTAKEFPAAGKFVMEVLGQDVCNPTIKYHAFIIFGNAKLNAAFDLGLNPDSGHPLEIAANQDYCDPEKRLFSIIIPDLT